jgi:hypothetical protein
MALSGEGAVCIWNDITPEGEAEFYAWHIEEHMPERVGIPGFRRGRRYIAEDGATSPRFFTLYETETIEVAVGQDYLNRLNAPTEWTKRATQGFRNTFRALTRVKASFGQGPGGALATLRMTPEATERVAIGKRLAVEVLPVIAREAMITGGHLCMTDLEASAGRTEESKGRDDIQVPPDTAVLIEGCRADAVAAAAAKCIELAKLTGTAAPVVGLYRHEYTRLKTGWAAG